MNIAKKERGEEIMVDIRELFVDRAELYIAYLKKVDKLLKSIEKHSPNSVEFSAICSTATYFKSAGEITEHTTLLKNFRKQENLISAKVLKDLARFDDESVNNGEVYGAFVDEKALVEECLFDLSAKTMALCHKTKCIDLKTEVAFSAIEMNKLQDTIEGNLRATEGIMQSNLFDIEKEKETKKKPAHERIASVQERHREGHNKQ